MKFRKVKRPKLAAKREARPAAKTVRAVAEICPWCGGVETLRAYKTKRVACGFVRYGMCTKCGKPVNRLYAVAKKR